MTLETLKQTLHRLLDDKQQNAIAEILEKIKNSGYGYDGVLYISVVNSLTPHTQGLIPHNIVQSTRALIETLCVNPEVLTTELAQKAEDLSDAKKIYAMRQRWYEEIYIKADRELALHYPEIIFDRIFTGAKLADNEMGEIRNLSADATISWQRKRMVVAALIPGLK